jgi:hypothetical protein
MCHPEAQPKDLDDEKEILRFAQNDIFAVTLDTFNFSHFKLLTAAPTRPATARQASAETSPRFCFRLPPRFPRSGAADRKHRGQSIFISGPARRTRPARRTSLWAGRLWAGGLKVAERSARLGIGHKFLPRCKT